MANQIVRPISGRLRQADYPSRAPHVASNMEFWLELARACLVEANVVDLFAAGFGIRFRSVLYVGENMKVLKPTGSLLFGLRWVDGLSAGGTFLEPAEIRSW